MQIRIDDLHFRVRQDIAGGNFTRTDSIDHNLLGFVAVQLYDQFLQIQDDLRYILFYSLDR